MAMLTLLTGAFIPQRGSTAPQPLFIYCAAALKPGVDVIAKQYQQEYGITIQAQYGASGTLLSNIKISQQGDVYLPADESFIALAHADSLIGYTLPLVRMHPVIMVKKGNPRHITSLNDLINRNDLKIAYCDPDSASIGKITRAVLSRTGDWRRLEPRITVMLPTVTDAANAVKLGTVDAAIVWDAVAKQYPEATAVEVPIFQQAEQSVVVGVLTTSTQTAAAARFVRYLGASNKGLVVFKKLGYKVVTGQQWKE